MDPSSSMHAAAILGSDVRPVLPTRGPPDDRVQVAAANGTAVSAQLTRYLADDHDRIAQGINDVVVHRIVAAGLELQGALTLVRDHRAAGKIYHAIDELDHAIRDIRATIFELGPTGSRPLSCDGG